MATTRTWVGGARRKQTMVQTVTVGSSTQNQTFIISLAHPSGAGLEAVAIASYTAGAAETTTTIADALETLMNSGGVGTGTGSGTGLPYHEFVQDVEVTQANAVITITARRQGVPFVCTVSGTGTLTLATTTVNAGPNDWDTPGNWLEGKVPIDDDDVTITGSVDILYGLDQSDIALDTLNVTNYSGHIGHRAYPLTIDAEEEIQFDFTGQCSLRFASLGCTLIVVHRTGGADYGVAFSALSGVNPTLTTMKVLTGRVLVGLTRGEKVTVTTLHNVDGDTTIFDGSDVATIHNSGTGVVRQLNDGFSVTLIRVDGGLVINYSPVATVTQNGGEFEWMQNDITTYNLNRGVLETRKSRLARTCSTLNQAQAGKLYRDTATVTITAHAQEGPMLIEGAGDVQL